MNKIYFTLSLLAVFILAFMSVNIAYASTDPVRQESYVASVTLVEASTSPVIIFHEQNTYILQYDSFTINGSLVPADDSITIDSVKLEYFHETAPGSPIAVSTNAYNNLSNAFGIFVDNINMAPNFLYYRIKVDYSKNFAASTVPVYSGMFTVKNPKIDHNDIIRISPFQRRMVPVGTVSNIGVTALNVEYYVNGSSGSLRVISPDNPVMFISEEINIALNESLVNYRLLATFDGDNTKIKYYPAEGWIEVPVISSASATIGTSGGTLILDNEDQRYGRSSVKIYENALQSDTGIIFEECDMDASYVWQASSNIIKIYKLNPDTVAFGEGEQPADLTLYYGNENNGKYEIKNWNGTAWDSLTTSQDLAKKTVSAKAASFGYFAVFDRGASADNDYRPLDRAFMPGETIQFRNLQPDDSVTIFNTKGKQIKKISNGDNDWKWDGRTSGGGYAESGSYIYQIKVNGKIISGSLAFVR